MPYHGKKITVVMPAYNAARTLQACYDALPKEWVDEAILVDDASADETVALARSLPLHVAVHEKNLGYGGNQKTCYRTALARGADVVVMVHPDHQYDPSFVPDMVRGIVDEGYAAVFGSRMMIRENALLGGMPRWKFFFNIVLTKIANFVLRLRLTELHSGFRAYDCRVLEKIDFGKNSDDFVFDTEIIIQLVTRRAAIKEIPISTRYFKEASQISLPRSIRYGVDILHRLFLHVFHLREY